MSASHVADTGLFGAMDQPSNHRYRAVRRFAIRNEITIVLPKPVYGALTVDESSVEPPPLDAAIEADRAEIADPLAYETPFVPRTMDGGRRFIAHADTRAEAEIERADAALAGVIAQSFADGVAKRAYIDTTDVAAGGGIETVVDNEGYGDSVTFVNAVRLIEDLLD